MNLDLSMPPMVNSALPTDFGVRYKLNKAMVGIEFSKVPRQDDISYKVIPFE